VAHSLTTAHTPVLNLEPDLSRKCIQTSSSNEFHTASSLHVQFAVCDSLNLTHQGRCIYSVLSCAIVFKSVTVECQGYNIDRINTHFSQDKNCFYTHLLGHTSALS
jgi:hypothetical protein